MGISKTNSKPSRKPSVKSVTSSKQASLYHHLHQQLSHEKLRPGEQIPAERKLAEQFSISYMTARSAVQTLVDEGLLVKRERVGIYVPVDINKRLNQPRVNVLAGESDNIYQTTFVDRITHRLARRRCFANLRRLGNQPSDITRAIAMLSDLDVPAVVMMGDYVRERELAQAMLAHPQLMLVGYDLTAIGLHSVLCDDAAAAQMAVNLLQKNGHRKIALIGRNAKSPIDQQIVRSFESSTASHKNTWFLPRSTKPMRYRVEQLISRHLKIGGLPCTAVICIGSETTNALIEVLQAFGISIHQQVSLVALGLADDLTSTHPRIACIDPQLDKQVDYAVNSAALWRRGKKVERLHCVSPRLITGNSISKLQ